MTQLNEEHFEVIDRNKAKRYPEQKIKKARDILRQILKPIITILKDLKLYLI